MNINLIDEDKILSMKDIYKSSLIVGTLMSNV